MTDSESGPWWLDVATCRSLVGAGWSEDAIDWRVSTGRWQRPVRGVVTRTSGELTQDQRRVVGLLYAGDGAMLSHGSAGALFSLCPEPTQVQVTTAHGPHVRSNDLVSVHQSLRPTEPWLIEDMLVTPPARTAIDLALGLTDLDAVHAVLGRSVQRRLATPEQLSHELAMAPKRGSMLPRVALEQVTAGAHAASEARFLRLVRRGGLPEPELNAPVVTADGVKFVDALWRQLGKGAEIDGRPYHFDPRAWAADLVRQNAIACCGITLLRILASRLWTDERAVLAELTAFLLG